MSDPMIQVFAGASESHQSTSYRWKNAERMNAHVIFQYTVDGFCRFRIGNKVTEVRKGEAFIAMPPEDSEYWYPDDADKPYKLQWISFNGEAAINLARYVRKHHGPVITMARNSEAFILFRRILALFENAEFSDRFQESELVHSLMMAVMREQVHQEQARDPVVYCYNYLQDHHRTIFNIKNLAGDAGISREHLTRAFSKRYGQTPAAMLSQLRLQTAINQLMASNQTLENIARSSGLANARTLSRLFLRETGKTPDQFRREGKR